MSRTVVDAAAEIGRLAGEMGRLHVRMLRLVAHVAAVEGFRYDGASSVESWLVARLGVARRTANAWGRVAGCFEELPETIRRWESGGLSFDQVHALAGYAEAEEEAAFAEEAESLPVGVLEREAKRRRRVNDREAKDARERRSLRWWWDEPAGLLRLEGALASGDGVVFVDAVNRLMTKAPGDPDVALAPLEQQRADAMLQLASQSLGADSDPDRATVVVHVQANQLSAGGAAGEVVDGPMLPPAVVDRLGCDGRIETVIHDGSGVPVGIGRASRQIPAWLRRQIAHRDQGCRFPGCETTYWVHIHHLVHWSRGGRTDLDNLVTLCGFHHRLVHEHGWRITGDPNRDLGWVRPDGSVYEGVTILRQTIRDLQKIKFPTQTPATAPDRPTTMARSP